MTNIGILENNLTLSKNYVDFFENQAEYNVVFQFSTLTELQKNETLLQAAHVVVLNTSFADGNGIDAIKLLRSHKKSPKTIVVTSKIDPDFVTDALKNGADSYLLKSDGIFELQKAIKETINGGLVLSPTVAKVFVAYIFSADKVNFSELFTHKETEIIALVQQGLSYKEMASSLHVTPFTINHHLKNIYKKGGVSSRSQLMVLLQKKRKGHC